MCLIIEMRILLLSALLFASAFQTALGDKFKAVLVAYILFVSGLHADDDKARMERDKNCNKPASELTTEAPKTVRAVQQSSVVCTTKDETLAGAFLEALGLALKKDPKLTSEFLMVGQEILKEDGAKPADLFKAPETNSVSNHSHSK